MANPIVHIGGLLIAALCAFVFHVSILRADTPPVYSAQSSKTILEICKGGSDRLAPSNETVPSATRYEWQPSINLSSSTDATPRVTALRTEQYVRIAYNGAAELQRDTVVVFAIEPKPVQFTLPDGVCERSTAIYAFTPEQGEQYTCVWTASNASGTAQPQLLGMNNTAIVSYQWNGSGSGRVSLRIQYTRQQCEVSGGFTETVNPLPNPHITPSTPSTTVCKGTAVTLDAGSGYATYFWSTGSTDRGIVVTDSGVYSVTVRTAASCEAKSQPLTIAWHPELIPTISGTAKLCDGDVATLTAETGFTNYQWSNGTQGQVLSVIQPGAYTVRALNQYGCEVMSRQFNVMPNLATVAMPKRLEFVTSGVDTTQRTTFYVRNTSTDTIIVKGVSLFDAQNTKQPFRIIPSGRFPYVMFPGDSIEVTAEYSPTERGEFNGQCVTEIISPCRGYRSLQLNGITYNPSVTLYARVPDSLIQRDGNIQRLPLVLNLAAGDTSHYTGVPIVAQFRWRADVFHPTGISNGDILANTVENGERILTLRATAAHIDVTPRILTYIEGSQLTSRILKTPLYLDSLRWETVKRPLALVYSGTLIQVDAKCAPFGITFTDTELSALHVVTSANGETQTELYAGSAGEYTATLYAMTGNPVAQQRLYATSKGMLPLAFDEGLLASGQYVIGIQSATEYLRALIHIQK